MTLENKIPYSDPLLDDDKVHISRTWFSYFQSWANQIILGVVQSITGTAGRIQVSGTPINPIFNIDPDYLGQESITTVGTVGSGEWQATPLRTPYLNIGAVKYTDSTSNFTGLIASIGSATTTVYVNSLVSITSNLTIPSNISIVVLKGGSFAISPGVTLTFANPFGLESGRFQVFAGLGLVAGLKYLEPDWFGFVGDGITDDAPAIVRTYNAIRALGGVVDWRRSRVLMSYGVHHPAECVTFLSGSYLIATTAFGQGTIPSGGVSTAFFSMGASVTSNAVLVADYKNQSIIGDFATLDGNFLNQTGTPPGYSGILLETTPAPIEANYLRVKNVLIQDLTITTVYRYGLYLEGVEDCEVRSVRVLYAGTNATSIIGGKNILFDNVEGSWTRENLTEPEYGFGFWNEPNESWQSITNLRYVNCYAEYNYQGGFLPWNPGQDAGADIKLTACRTFRNSWDAAATPDRFTGIPGDYHSSVTAAGFLVSMEAGYSGSYCIEVDNCTAIEEYQSGFKVKRSTGLQTNSIIRFKNPTAYHCVVDDADGYERAAISVVGTADPAYATRVEILNPTIVAPPANTAGYMIGAVYTQDIVVQNPTFYGTATYKAIYANLPAVLYKADGEPNNVLDVGSDDQGGIIGDASQFFKPVRLPYFDQATEPAELLTNQIVIWKVEDDVFVGMFNHYDASIGVPGIRTRYIPMMSGFGAANQLLKSNDTGNGWKHSAVTIDENNVINNAERINVNGAADHPSAAVNAIGNMVTQGPGGGAYSAYGLGAPGDTNLSRAVLIHDDVTADIRSLASGTGVVAPVRLVAGGGVGDPIFSLDRPTHLAALDFADLSITRLGKGLKVKAGTNGKINLGNVLVAGTVTVANTSVTAGTMFTWNRKVAGGTLGHITIAGTAGVGYTITSSSATETSTIDVMLTEAT